MQLVDASGTVIAETTPTKAFATVVISAAGITTGQEYSIVVDGTATTVTAGTAISGGGFGGMTPPDGGSGAGAPPSGGGRQ
ncbi:hypothetical protein HNR16_002030 [Pseudoclavibacter chungangensis]|uniref:hypothetical protein n=1 Tax=Pseudoclavibacter chungangensis TaxID=587635 RepID=UPI0018186F87|nr:hypothetical protein [Pseudoclavibacter chungangensis]NYJ67242.1 hypothetical protein [Pseudoclavibacter chungangensis]